MLSLQAALCTAGQNIRRGMGTTKVLHGAWKERHSVFYHDMQKEIQGETKLPLCLQLGLCVCDSKAPLWLWDNLKTLLKKHFWKKKKQPSPLRVLLEHAKIVVQLKAAQAEEQIQDACGSDCQSEVVWFCPAYVHFGNWHFSAMQLFPSSEEPLAAPALGQEFQMLEVRIDRDSQHHQVFTDVMLFKQAVSFSHKWKLRFWQIADESGFWPLDASAANLPVVPCDCDCFWVWTGLKNEIDRRRSKQPPTDSALKRKWEAPQRGGRGRGSKGSRPKRGRGGHGREIEDGHVVSDSDVPMDSAQEFEQISALESLFGNQESEADAFLMDLNVDQAEAGSGPDADHGDHGNAQLEAESQVIEALLELAGSDCQDVSDFDPSESDESYGFGSDRDSHDDDGGDDQGEDFPQPHGAAASSSSSPAAAASAGVAPPMPSPPAEISEPPPDPPEALPGPREIAPGRKRRQAGDRLAATDTLDLGVSGSIRYYEHQSSLVAVCTWPGHKDCRLTRTTKPSASGGKKALGQGRPLGLMFDWLTRASDFENQTSHLHGFTTTATDRSNARKKLMQRFSAAHAFSMNCERSKRSDEDSEPECIR